MATSPASDTDEEEPGFTDEEIAESIAPFLAEVDADYAAQVDAIVEALRAKGPPKPGHDQPTKPGPSD